MILSMTGYGSAENKLNTTTYTVEIRSLNSAKGFDLMLKNPSKFKSLEMNWRNQVNEKLQRGKIDVSVNFKSDESIALMSLDKLEASYREIEKVANTLQADKTGLLASLLPMLSGMDTDANGATEDEMNIIQALIEKACNDLHNFRIKEGATIAADIHQKIDNIQKLLNQTKEQDKNRLASIKSKIEDRMAQFIPSESIDTNRLEQEIIFYLEKMDINEEISRLSAHILYCKETMNSDENILGRKLNFIAQEMGREINTIGSKANDVDIQKLVVGMKDELEKIKEQTNNVL
jgi:uncharacterized protein (TIGR00255 family)